MKPYNNNYPQDLRDIEVPAESMDAMARQIHALERVSAFRRRLIGLSSAAAVVLAIVTVGWPLLTGKHTDRLPSGKYARTVTYPVAVADTAGHSAVLPSQEPEYIPPCGSRQVAAVVRHRSLTDEYTALSQAHQHGEADVTVLQERIAMGDCPIMVYESGKLVACGSSLEEMPEVCEFFRDLAHTMDASQKTFISGVETLDETVKITYK